MISHQRKLIYIRQFKAASSSIMEYMLREDKSITNDVDWGLLGTDRSALQVFSDYEVFSVVRNPWDRFLSGVDWCSSTRGANLKTILRNPPKPNLLESAIESDSITQSVKYFLEWFHRVGPGRSQFLLSLFGKQSANWGPDHDYEHVIRTQTSRFIQNDGTSILDHLFYFENLATVQEFISHSSVPEFKHEKNNSVRKRTSDYREVFDEESKAMFAEFFEQDINVLGYLYENGPGFSPTRTP